MPVPDLDPVIHQPARLAILSLLFRNRQARFVRLREELGLTDGNLASHAGKLEAAGYITSARILADLSFHLVYRITPEGSEAFRRYVEALQAWLLASVPDAQESAPVSSVPSSSKKEYKAGAPEF